MHVELEKFNQPWTQPGITAGQILWPVLLKFGQRNIKTGQRNIWGQRNIRTLQRSTKTGQW